MSIIKKEELIKEQHNPISIEGAKIILSQMKNSICKIYLKNDKIGIRFLCKIPFHNKLLQVSITNNNNIENDKKLKLIIKNEEKEIIRDKSRKIHRDNKIIIIEIKPNKDKIYYFLELDENEIYKEKNEYTKYIIRLYNEEISISYDIINEIKKIYNPILSLKIYKLIGIYNYKNINKKYLIDKFNNCKNEINIIYEIDEEGVENIFGDKFVKNNKNKY